MKSPLLILCVLSAHLALTAGLEMRIEPKLALIDEVVTIVCELPKNLTYDLARIHHDDTSFFSAVTAPPGCDQRGPEVRPTFSKEIVEQKATKHSVRIKFKALVPNSGMYVCRFISGLTEYTSEAKQLVVGKPAWVKKLVVKPDFVIGGKDMSVACVGTKGIPPGKLWIEDNFKQTVETKEQKVTDMTNKPLIKISAAFPASKLALQQTYICHAKNVFNTERKDIKVNTEDDVVVPIYHPPYKLRITPNVTHAKNGDVFVCTGDGFPQIEFKWIVNTSGVITTVKGDRIKLDLDGDGGISCVAENTIAGAIFSERKNLWFKAINGTEGLIFNVHRDKALFMLNSTVEPPPEEHTEENATEHAEMEKDNVTTTVDDARKVEVTTPHSKKHELEAEHKKEIVTPGHKNTTEEVEKSVTEKHGKGHAETTTTMEVEKESKDRGKKEEEEKKKKEEDEKKKKEEEEKKKEKEEKDKKEGKHTLHHLSHTPGDFTTTRGDHESSTKDKGSVLEKVDRGHTKPWLRKEHHFAQTTPLFPKHTVEEAPMTTPAPSSAPTCHDGPLMFYLKLSVGINVIFGTILLIFLIGVCIRMSNMAK